MGQVIFRKHQSFYILHSIIWINYRRNYNLGFVYLNIPNKSLIFIKNETSSFFKIVW